MICMGSVNGVFDPLRLLGEFVRQVVSLRRDTGRRKRANREDLGSLTYAWLRPGFVPPSPYLVTKDKEAQSSRILVEPHLIDAEF